jgi:tetratricopeptide (TPR) repeat protein
MKRFIPALLALAMACARGADAGPDAQESLYQDALRALAEGRRTDASESLRRLVEQEPRHAGAWLDLALIQCGLGNSDEAERLFATVETRFAPSRDILELIAQAREDGCRPWTPTSALTLSVGRGVDRNVNQGASTSALRLEGSTIELPLLDDFLPKRDNYKVVGLEYLRDLTPNGTIGFAQLQWRRNDHLHQYDTASAFGGVESPWRFGGWALRTTGLVGMVGLGGHQYQRQAQGQLRVSPPLPLPDKVSFNLMGGATVTDYKRLNNFDAHSLELRPELSYRSSGLLANASLGFVSDHGNAGRPGGDRHGQFLNLLVRKSLFGESIGELAYTRQTWRSAEAYAPALLIPQVRDQATQALRATLTYPVAKHHSLQLEARAVQNRENILIFQYNNRQLQLSWLWQP